MIQGVRWALFSLVAQAAVSTADIGAPADYACLVPEAASVRVNELNSDNSKGGSGIDFVELAVVGNNVDIDGWRLCAANAPHQDCWSMTDGTWHSGGASGTIPATGAIFDAPTWLVFRVDDLPEGSKLKQLSQLNGEVLLLNGEEADSTSNVIDYLAYSKEADCSDVATWTIGAACGFCFDEKKASEKDLARQPDGTGDWANNGGDSTEGGSNDGGGGAGSVDHYALSLGSPAVTCEAATITVIAHDVSHNPIEVGSDILLTVTTTPAVDAISNNSVTIVAGTSAASFSIQQTTALAGIDIDVSDGTATELDGDPSEDPSLDFVDAAFRFYADGAPVDTNPIGVQIAGKPNTVIPGNQALTLRAVQTNTQTGACEAALSGIQPVEIGYECDNPVNCAVVDLLSVSGATTETVARNDQGAVLAYRSIDMSFDGNGEAPFSMTFGDAGKIVLHARKAMPENPPDPAFTLQGSSNGYVTRPFGFDLDFADARAGDWLDNGALDGSGGDASYAASATGSAFVAAGADFELQVSAVLWQSADDGDGDGAPDPNANLTDNGVTPNFGQEDSPATVSLGYGVMLPAGGESGTVLSGGVSGFAEGAATATLNWSEVGIIGITATSAGYLDAGADIAGVALDVGRFYPDHFELSVLADGALESPCAAFVYTGQLVTGGSGALSYDGANTPVLRITPRSRAGGLTQNYSGGFMGLTPADVAITAPSQDATQLGRDSVTLMKVAASLAAGSLSEETVAGQAGYVDYRFSGSDRFYYRRDGNSRVAPFIASLGLTVAEVRDRNGDGDDSNDVLATGSLPALTPSGLEVRYGRLRPDNAFGPETEDLAVPARLEFYDGSRFVLNALDNCTTLDVAITAPVSSGATVSVGEGTSTLSYNQPAVDGELGVRFSAPGAGNTGEVAFRFEGPLAGPGIASLPWLLGDWDGDGDDDDEPGARTATFGLYRGHDRVILWQESFSR